MKVETTEITGPLLICPDVYYDARGYLLEQFHRARYADAGLETEFVQDNCSYSRGGCVRGLHYQVGDCPQGKLVMVLEGSILDVAVDIRFGSPTFGQHVAVELSSENHNQFWVPLGFAHGFSVLSEGAVVYYKCTSPYAAHLERSVLFSDPDLGIDWRVQDPLVSERDADAPLFRLMPRDFIYPCR